jgi:ribulose-phosphate 3-epimerase
MIILPSILSSDFCFIYDEISVLKELGINHFHLDVMDGHFVQNISFGVKMVSSIRSYFPDVFLDVHLMIANLDLLLLSFLETKPDLISFHVEAASDLTFLIHFIQSKGVKAGIALNPTTPFSSIKKHLSEIDHLLIMSVQPGFSGQLFIVNIYEKIEEIVIYKNKNNLKFKICVDGGINNLNIIKLKQFGIDMVVIGDFLFNKKEFNSKRLMCYLLKDARSQRDMFKIIYKKRLALLKGNKK